MTSTVDFVAQMPSRRGTYTFSWVHAKMANYTKDGQHLANTCRFARAGDVETHGRAPYGGALTIRP